MLTEHKDKTCWNIYDRMANRYNEHFTFVKFKCERHHIREWLQQLTGRMDGVQILLNAH